MRDTNCFVTMSNEDIKLEFLGNLVWVKFDNNPRDSILFTNLFSNQMGSMELINQLLTMEFSILHRLQVGFVGAS
jgi:hypothetical protein